MAITAFAIVYIWGLGHFIVRLRYLDPEIIGIRGVLLFVAVVKATDIMAYLVGSRWGRHRPFPHVSPNKTWEGYVGGFVASLAVGVFTWWVLFDHRWYWALVFSAPVSVAAHLGDLAESVIKRSAKRKPCGSLEAFRVWGGCWTWWIPCFLRDRWLFTCSSKCMSSACCSTLVIRNGRTLWKSRFPSAISSRRCACWARTTRT